MHRPAILVAGGKDDPNLLSLLRVLKSAHIEESELLIGKESPSLEWDIDADRLLLDGRPISPQAIFVRYDVFGYLYDMKPEVAERAHSWYTAILGWAAAHADVKLLNRLSFDRSTNKPYVLSLARECGLRIPATRVTNHVGALADGRNFTPLVVKPVNGGGYCQPLDEVLSVTKMRRGAVAAPAIVQARLVSPDVRIYVIKSELLGFKLLSQELDYRRDPKVKIEVLTGIPSSVRRGLRRLMERLGLDFGAADFKTCSRSGALRFLEINSAPMFAGFDQTSEDSVSLAIVRALCPDQVPLKLQ